MAKGKAAAISYAIAGCLALMIMVGEAQMRDQRQAPPPTPRLRMTRLSGELRIEPPPGQDSAGEPTLPYIRSGSTLRVLSGAAVFESDHHAVVRAKKGASFLFTANSWKEDPPRALVITLAARAPEALEVTVIGEKFLLEQDGSKISVIPEGGTKVRVAVSGQVQLVTASDSREAERIEYGEFPETGVGIPSGSWISVRVPKKTEFKSAPVELASLRVSRASGQALAVTEAGREPGGALTTRTAARVIERWPKISRRVAEMIQEKYGAPDRVLHNALVWYGNGPWHRTEVRRSGDFHGFPEAHVDVLRQSVRYRLATDKVRQLERLDAGLEWNHDARELSAVGESEEANMLALNVADDVSNGRLGVAQGRALLVQATAAANAGKISHYMKSISFQKD